MSNRPPDNRPPEVNRERARLWYHANKQRAKEGHTNRRLAAFGLTAEGYAALLAAQGGVCAICKQPPKVSARWGTPERLRVDHDHSCCPPNRACVKCIRGLLCAACNLALGSFEDDPARLRAAADYLDTYRRFGPDVIKAKING